MQKYMIAGQQSQMIYYLGSATTDFRRQPNDDSEAAEARARGRRDAMSASAIRDDVAPTRKRYVIVMLLFITVAINYLDRSNLSIAAPGIAGQLKLSPASMGWIFSAWGWAYAAFQIPGGWLADRIPPRRLAFLLVCLWSCATLALGFASGFIALIILRLLIGMFEAPSYPIKNRVATTWFPESQRARAIGIYTSAQFAGLAFLTPVLSWLYARFGWNSVFIFSGGLGIVWSVVWYAVYREPRQFRGVNAAEVEFIRTGGGIPDLADRLATEQRRRAAFRWRDLAFLLTRRKLWGLYLGQFGLGGTTLFFLTWFPTYLVQYRHMAFIRAGFAASIPFLFGFLGVWAAGFSSDFLLRKGWGIGASRKIPVVAGLLLSTTILGANFVDDQRLVILFMTIAFFGTGLASIVWSLVSTIAPERLIGLTGGVFNFIGGLSGIIVPIGIGYLASGSSFAPALVFVSCLTLLGAFSYGVVIGKVERLQAPELPATQGSTT
jgi:MFS transporter, ACS family, D-galactonate transporter